jgi:hypothetical protein
VAPDTAVLAPQVCLQWSPNHDRKRNRVSGGTCPVHAWDGMGSRISSLSDMEPQIMTEKKPTEWAPVPVLSVSRTGGRCRRGPPWAWGGWCGTGYRSSRTSSLSPPSPARDKEGGVGGQQSSNKQRTRTSPYCFKTLSLSAGRKMPKHPKGKGLLKSVFSGPDLDWIRIQSGQWIRLYEGINDPQK